MKNLIVYATKYGYAQRCALELAKKLPGTTDVIDIQNCESPDPSDYENVIIGAPYTWEVSRKKSGNSANAI